MSGIMDDETLRVYVQESREHLETIETDLLAIESQGKEIDDELINKVFRAAHSIKGGASFLSLDTIKELAHKIENVLDMIRHLQLIPTSNVVNTLLSAFDHLGMLLDKAAESNDLDIQEHIAALEGITLSSLAPEAQESSRREIQIEHPAVPITFTITEFDLKQFLRGGKILYILKYDLIKHIHRQNKVPFDVINLLKDVGIIIDITLSLAEVGDLDSKELCTCFPMYVLFSSIIEPDLISSVVGLPEGNIHAVSEQTAAKQAAVAQPASTAEHAAPENSQPAETPSPQEDSVPAFVKTPLPKNGDRPKAAASSQPETLRVHVEVLNQLMNRAGELVLARNQLLQALSTWEKKNVITAGQRVDLVTSELQEIIMLTRMQPVGNIFNKFPRVVRDMSHQLGKEIVLELEGGEVELDKTIIEGLADPLTHLVRNSADHGIELPEIRKKNGKPPTGRIVLRAFHESGQVIIEIEDDGKGLDPEMILANALKKNIISPDQLEGMTERDKINLIMLPGFSTAEKVTEVSGRGVGMDVVKTNLDKLGGHIDIKSDVGKGTIISIKLPLTLAIIPSLLITSCGHRFALPQVNVGELIQIPANEIRHRIESIGGAEVLILRGDLIPLLNLHDVLSLQPTYLDRQSGQKKPDRRATMIDKRLAGKEPDPPPENAGEAGQEEDTPERRHRRESDINIVVVQAGSFKYGLVVDAMHDTAEIVVKPLGRHLKHCRVYAGATIMGDGHVALILDVPGLAQTADLKPISESDRAAYKESKFASGKEGAIKQTLLLFRNGQEEQCGVPLHLVLRVEQIKQDDIEIKGGKKVIQYRGGTLPVFALEEAANVEMLEAREQLNVIIFVVAGHEVGLLSVPPLDILDVDLALDEMTLRQPGIQGSAIIRDQTTLLIDIFGLMQILNPNWFEERKGSGSPELHQEEQPGKSDGAFIILLAEDSNFFRAQVKQFVEDEGYVVMEARDGVEAWEYLQAHQVDLVLTDIEMPRLNGFELTRQIKTDERFAHIPVIALTSLAGEEDVEKGKKAGIDDYQIKIDKENLLQGIYRFARKNRQQA